MSNRETSETSIYCLVDPRTCEVRYVGKTVQPIESRITAHMRDKTKCHRVHWLSELKSEGLRPVGVVLEDVHGAHPWQESERFWIRRLRSMGARLVNNTDGGDGVPGLPAETRQRMRAVWLGRKHTPETIQKLCAARRLRVTTEATREKMSQTRKGCKITWGKTIAESVRKLTRQQVGEIADRLRGGELVKDIAAEFGLHRTTVSKIRAGSYLGIAEEEARDLFSEKVA